MKKVELYNDCKNLLGEGITWSADQENLYWLDVVIPSKLFQLHLPTNKLSTFIMPEMISSISIRSKKDLIIASQYGVYNYNLTSNNFTRLIETEPLLKFNRSNDGASDIKGRFWFGTMQNNLDEEGQDIPITKNSGSLYRLNTDLTLDKIESNLGIPNTFIWNPDNTKFYFTDSMEGIIYSYDFNEKSGEITNKTNFATFNRGVPDGSTMDSEGFVWNCRWGGSCVVRFDPLGRVDRVLEVPVENVTNCVFGGKDLKTLFITTARQGLSKEYVTKNPYAGSLFAIDLSIKGIEDNNFLG
ncbi:uncharacterized protein METZ01_LOCUS91300 [marine metagenome]|uniref:SMP-30/Gluconolactonase/LRE-like region domain-containing protein n=1 Tax=marine metagenome TaxID=408172 RepID=A0A381VDL6_9ZZZZ